MRESGPVPLGFEGGAAEENPGIAAEEQDYPVRRFRLIFGKSGDLRFLSHLEVLRTFIRAAQRGGLRMAHTQGFNPHPKIVFARALPLGMESRAEIVDFALLETEGALRPRDILRALQRELPAGLRPRAAWQLKNGAPASANAIAGAMYEIRLPANLLPAGVRKPEEIEYAIARTLAADQIEIRRERKGKIIHFDARPAIRSFEAKGPVPGAGGELVHRLLLELRFSEGATPKVSDILLACLELPLEDFLRARVLKIAVRWKSASRKAVEYAI